MTYGLLPRRARPESVLTHPGHARRLERKFFIDNLLVRIHIIIEMILVDRPCAMGVWIPFLRLSNIYIPMPGDQSSGLLECKLDFPRDWSSDCPTQNVTDPSARTPTPGEILSLSKRWDTSSAASTTFPRKSNDTSWQNRWKVPPPGGFGVEGLGVWGFKFGGWGLGFRVSG